MSEAPAVCRAGLFQFAAQQRYINRCVQSRALFWCKSGRGEFVVDGVEYPLEPHDLYLLPWNRCITYRPSLREPMYTAHVHLVPRYRPGSPWFANVPHEKGQPDPYHFSKLFRRHVGLSPREFRERHGLFSRPPPPSTHQVDPSLRTVLGG